MTATLITPAADLDTLKSFCMLTNPGGPGWRRVYASLDAEGRQPVEDAVNLPRGILCMLLGCAAVYSVLFATGFLLYGQVANAVMLGLVTGLSAAGIVWLRFND